MPEKEAERKEKLNIHQKILKIADAAGVLQKTKEGFNYKYVPEEEIQAKVTACMQKYGVMLYPSIVPGTMSVTPYSYQKPKTKRVKNEKGKDVIVDYTVPVNEIIVQCEVEYTWVNVENPDFDRMVCRWAYIGQMEDASQAFGAGATYGNRYYLMKALQLATTEADPDSYRSKQKEAEFYEEEKEQKAAAEKLAEEVKKVVAKGTELIKGGVPKEEVMAVVGKYNDDNQNPSSIKTIEVCEAVMKEFAAIELAKKQKKKTPATSKQKGEEKE